MFSVLDVSVELPDEPVVVKLVIQLTYAVLKCAQSPEDNAPLFVALADGTFKVITGVVVPVATLLDKSVPVVPNVKAATDVTVPEP